MKKPDLSVVKALIWLKTQAPGRTILEWFAESLQDQRLQNEDSDGVEHWKGTGKAIGLNDILQQVDAAEEDYNRFATREQRRAQKHSGIPA